MRKKPLFFSVLLTFLFLFCSSCQKTLENCKIRPDLEKIGEEITESVESKREIDVNNIKSVKAGCNF
jgi:hypothetical protein